MRKEDFLQSVQQALGKGKREPQEGYAPLLEGLAELQARADSLRERLERERPQLLDKLAEVAQARGWNVLRAAGAEEAIAQVSELVSSLGASLVVRSGQEVFQELPIDEALAGLDAEMVVMEHDQGDSREAMRQTAAQADLGITGVDYAVAETGSVVLLPRRHLSRLTSLLPPVHLAIVRPQEVVGRLDDLFLLRRLAYHQGDGDMGSYLNFITGPSRTADIEQTIVIGVHGPRQVHMLILG